MKDNLFDNETFLARWMAGELSEAELEEFRKHPDFAFYQKVANHSEKLNVPGIQDEEVLLDRIKSRSQHTNSKIASINNTLVQQKTFSRRVLIGLLSAAAMALLLVGYFNWFTAKPLRYLTAVAELQSLSLPDGSMVTLNANSALEVPANNFEKNRRLNLNGEAFFKVEEGSTFSVLTDNGTVSVLGTEFSVFSRGERLSVSCKSGSVRVENNAGKFEILGPGDKVYILEDRLTPVQEVSTASIGSWTTGVSSFESEYLSIVTQMLENQFDVQIKLPRKIANERYTGSFLHNDLETALRMVFAPMNLEYRKIDDQTWEVIKE